MGAQTLHLPTTSGELQLIGKHSEYLEDQQHHRTWKAIENAPFAPVQEDIALFNQAYSSYWLRFQYSTNQAFEHSY